ncbi:TonB-dependent receptor plug domain-containing protein, partial [bacterium LRH843]|nr:TonB-dependent receptor plug domain-containing protein [bacterium LRH843]
AAQSSSPITVIKVDEILKQGVTTTEEALSKITANQSNFVTASNVGTSRTQGSSANLRGLGANKTLVLLNGRRLAANAYDSGVTNLNIIPLAMLDRIEVLRDGASAVYGTDAIGGVVNFITKKQFNGLNFSADYQKPEEKGGEQQSYSIFGGFGDLEENGFNAFRVIDYRRGEDIMAEDRKASRRGGVLPELGVNRT